MIGEQFAEPSEICGAVISVRQKGDRISLWTKTASNEAVTVRFSIPSHHPFLCCQATSPCNSRSHSSRPQINLGKQLKSFLDISGHIGYMVRAFWQNGRLELLSPSAHLPAQPAHTFSLAECA